MIKRKMIKLLHNHVDAVLAAPLNHAYYVGESCFSITVKESSAELWTQGLKLKAKEAILTLKSGIFSTNSHRPLWPAHISHQPTGTVSDITTAQGYSGKDVLFKQLLLFRCFPPLHCLNQEGDPAGVFWHLLFPASRSGEDPPGHVLCPDNHRSSHRVWELHQPEQVVWAEGFPPQV